MSFVCCFSGKMQYIISSSVVVQCTSDFFTLHIPNLLTKTISNLVTYSEETITKHSYLNVDDEALTFNK